jgi:hypothetical protein
VCRVKPRGSGSPTRCGAETGDATSERRPWLESAGGDHLSGFPLDHEAVLPGDTAHPGPGVRLPPVSLDRPVVDHESEGGDPVLDQGDVLLRPEDALLIGPSRWLVEQQLDSQLLEPLGTGCGAGEGVAGHRRPRLARDLPYRPDCPMGLAATSRTLYHA